MKKDKSKTKVLFLIEGIHEDVLAVFPKEYALNKKHQNYKTRFLCYSTVGQHSICDVSYYKNLPPATAEQYKYLKEELESIGYNLEILNT